MVRPAKSQWDPLSNSTVFHAPPAKFRKCQKHRSFKLNEKNTLILSKSLILDNLKTFDLMEVIKLWFTKDRFDLSAILKVVSDSLVEIKTSELMESLG